MASLALAVTECEENLTEHPADRAGAVMEEGSYQILADEFPFGYKSNFPCPICRSKIALFNTSQGTMNPCGDCREKGFITLRKKKNNWFVRWILSMLMAENSGRATLCMLKHDL